MDLVANSAILNLRKNRRFCSLGLTNPKPFLLDLSIQQSHIENCCRKLCYRDKRNGIQLFVIVVGDDKKSAGSIGYWEKAWQSQQIWETGWSVLPEFQGQGVATRATVLVVERARAVGKHRFLHAFPSVDNAPSNAICRKVGFTLRGEVDFGFPPGHMMRCNDWSLDLFPEIS